MPNSHIYKPQIVDTNNQYLKFPSKHFFSSSATNSSQRNSEHSYLKTIQHINLTLPISMVPREINWKGKEKKLTIILSTKQKSRKFSFVLSIATLVRLSDSSQFDLYSIG